MIPQHLIDKAARAMHANGPIGGETEEYEDTPPWYQVVTERRARAALEAAAAEIWDEGWSQGMAYIVGMERGTDDDELDHAITNPYHPEETA